MTAPGSFSAGDVLTAADMNALPGGLISYTTHAVGVAGSTNPTTIATVTFTHTAGRDLLVVYYGAVSFSSIIGGVYAVESRTDGVRNTYANQYTTGLSGDATVVAHTTATGSSQTVDIRIWMGTTSTVSRSEFAGQLSILDIGP